MRLVLATIFILLTNPLLAAEWQGPDDILQAAAKGNPEAQLEMGILYQYGFNMPGNKVPALAWYLASAQQGNQAASEKSDKLQKEMLPTEVEEARRLSQDLAALTAISSHTTSKPGYKPEMEQPAEAPAGPREPAMAPADSKEPAMESAMPPDSSTPTQEPAAVSEPELMAPESTTKKEPALPEPLPEVTPEPESKQAPEAEQIIPLEPAK